MDESKIQLGEATEENKTLPCGHKKRNDTYGAERCAECGELAPLDSVGGFPRHAGEDGAGYCHSCAAQAQRDVFGRGFGEFA